MVGCFSFSTTGSSIRIILQLLLLLLVWGAQAEPFKCNSPSRCSALVGYVSPNATTYARLQSLFNGTTSFTSLLAANALSPSTPLNYSVPAGTVVKIPFPCICSNGTGVSNKVPVYTVVPQDGLFHIASEVYSGLVTFPEIQRVNNIPNANLILVGQGLWIPLPCSCDDVDGNKVVHYGHLVTNDSTIEGIAQHFGTTPQTLSRLNGINSPSELKEGSVIDVPLRACDSKIIRNDSPDSSLLVPNGTYALTANDCVNCNCDGAANNWMLQCTASQMKPATNSTWSTCPTMQCQGVGGTSRVLGLGNATGSSCNSSTCAYAGYSISSQTIFTKIDTTTCPSPGSGGNSWAVSIEGSWKQQFPIFIVGQLLLFLSFFYNVL